MCLWHELLSLEDHRQSPNWTATQDQTLHRINDPPQSEDNRTALLKEMLPRGNILDQLNTAFQSCQVAFRLCKQMTIYRAQIWENNVCVSVCLWALESPWKIHSLVS